MFKKIINFFKKPLILILTIEVVCVFLIASGIFPRILSLPLTLLLLFFIILYDNKKGLFLIVASIPFFVALPITSSFDYMSSWRILIATLFLSWIIKSWLKNKKQLIADLKQILSEKFIVLSALFLLFAEFSLFNAVDFGIGVKKILFFINVSLLYILILAIIKNKDDVLNLIKSVIFAVSSIIAIGFAQFFITFKYPLYNFWQFWSKNIIPALYGNSLGTLLQVSNSWFSYYEEALPTLRMFSVFPDTHSFALIGVLGSPAILTLMLYYWQNKKTRNWLIALNIFTILSIILSGSRGIWFSILFPITTLIVIFFFFRSLWKKEIAKFVISFFIIFAILFPFSSYIFQMTQPPSDTENQSFLIFERAKSISDLAELSNKGRLEIWKESFYSIAKRPFLGVGIGNYPVILNLEMKTSKQGASAHNIYLDIASEMGVFAVLVFIAIFIIILSDSITTIKKIKDPIYYLFIFTFIVYITWIMCYSLFDVVLFNDKVLMLFMVNLGIIYTIKNIDTSVIIKTNENIN